MMFGTDMMTIICHKRYLGNTNTELRTLWWTIAVSLLACTKLYCVFEPWQCEWRFITSGLSASDFSFFLHYLSRHFHFWKRCIWPDILPIRIRCHNVTFLKTLPRSQILSSSYTSNNCVAQLLWGIAAFGSGRHTAWRTKDCRNRINILKIISCERALSLKLVLIMLLKKCIKIGDSLPFTTKAHF